MSNKNNDTIASGVTLPPAGIYLATVVSHMDTTFMGVLQVRLQRYSGGDTYAGMLYPVKYMTPYYGVTQDLESETNDYANAQTSYGMWMVPPDKGTTVIVVFAANDKKFGYWIGCVPDLNKNFMLPGVAATKYVVEGGGRIPVAEYNSTATGTINNATKAKKARHPFADALETQGLIKDDIRGITTSSARREVPSAVFGISTPGPIDKASTYTTYGTFGEEVQAPGGSRLGGTTFVMDDGDDKFLRKTLAGEGPPEYASTTATDTSGLPEVPHNELVRIRTRTGHQILLHNSEDLIYIGNAKGTTWIELTSNGKIDIFAEDSISIHTKVDLNIKADRDINLEAGRNVNIKAAEKAHVESGTDTEIVSAVDTKITSGTTSHISSGTTHLETAGKIYMNSASSPALAAEVLKTFSNTDETGAAEESIMLRVPSHEPWPHHENLDPLAVTPDLTDREAGSPIAVPTGWNEYSLGSDEDPFEHRLPPEAAPGDQA
jgi:hypothetical protein